MPKIRNAQVEKMNMDHFLIRRANYVGRLTNRCEDRRHLRSGNPPDISVWTYAVQRSWSSSQNASGIST